MEQPEYSSLSIGDRIPSLTVGPIGRTQLALFAGASGDHNPIHLDDEVARESGLPGSIVHGMLNMAFLGRLLTQWVPQQQIQRFSSRFVGMAFPGDEVTCSATVKSLEMPPAGNRVVLDLIAQNQSGEVLLKGSATIRLA
ncbi:MAG TPA: dehydratase [Gammaproteobacteria bacterium]|jgi:acyl dehydratase|nr:dehydratase [Acidiferrobacteraceae bacterium]MDP6399533.1 MaoC/PaaZ C-terminal domain-containing protein [Arenicellales bacterium]HCX87921.1 dehydratase [Gammaproteobacteria bacterium]MDP6552272.1 MaoC/PaaZ C-terminal domain-containing protein [Arenicellales bacterium]MDP6790553.1 MaoC/PaaZ C-terminal domain-containing protein [Arenicellales bacterium]|tara:strand:- start:39611 stop:40030 length:420 start_codon:yes stop_codon:yes gene_type:complete